MGENRVNFTHMETRENKITYKVYSELDQLPKADYHLLQAAHAATGKSYAPYSQFYVGAAARLSDGKIVSGGNQENAAYPMCLCAERVVLSAIAAEDPHQIIESLAITVLNPRQKIQQPGAPCGACRQAISEKEDQQKQSIRIILHGESGPVFEFSSGKDLLPFAFGAELL